MIEARLPALAAFARRLAAFASRAAEAHGENLLRARRRDPQRWRDPRLLWPNFTGER